MKAQYFLDAVKDDSIFFHIIIIIIMIIPLFHQLSLTSLPGLGLFVCLLPQFFHFFVDSKLQLINATANLLSCPYRDRM